MSLGYFSGLSKAFLHVSIEIQARTRDRNLDQSLYGTCWLMNEFEDYSKTRNLIPTWWWFELLRAASVKEHW